MADQSMVSPDRLSNVGMEDDPDLLRVSERLMRQFMIENGLSTGVVLADSSNWHVGQYSATRTACATTTRAQVSPGLSQHDICNLADTFDP